MKDRSLFEVKIAKAELVLEQFTFNGDRTTAKETLNKAKVPYKERYKRIFIPLTSFLEARAALRHLPMTQSENYKTFMRHYAEGTPVVIEWHPSYCTVSGGVPIAHFVRAMSYFNEENRQLTSYKKGLIDGMEHLFHAEKGYFPSGLLDRAVEILRLQGVPFEVVRKFDLPPATLDLKPQFSFEPTQDQYDAVDALSASTNGIGKLPTGFGKTSYVACALIAKKGVKAMFLANQRVLIDDAAADFEDVFRDDDVTIGKIGDGVFNPGDITVASIQGIIAALKPFTESERKQLLSDIKRLETKIAASAEPDGELEEADEEREKERKEALAVDKRLLTNTRNKLDRAQERELRREELTRFLRDEVKLFIVDEAQVLGTSIWNQFLAACPAPYRYGLTATDTRTNGGRLEIIAATGERRYESSAADQIAKGRLSEFKAEFVEFDHGLSEEDCKGLKMEFHQAYQYFIVENEERNAILIDKMLEWAKEGLSVLALVTHINHAELVMAELERRGIPDTVYRFVSGQTATKRRKESIEDFRNGVFPILIGTSIFDVGFNAKNASRMVRFNAGSSEVREPQRAGRTVRKRDDGSHGEMFDILDVGCPFFKGQAFKRIQFLRNEFGKDRIKIVRKVASRRPHEFVVPEPAERSDALPEIDMQEALPF